MNNMDIKCYELNTNKMSIARAANGLPLGTYLTRTKDDLFSVRHDRFQVEYEA